MDSIFEFVGSAAVIIFLCFMCKKYFLDEITGRLDAKTEYLIEIRDAIDSLKEPMESIDGKMRDSEMENTL